MRKPSGYGRVLLLLIPPLFLLIPIGTITFAVERVSNNLILDGIRSDGLPKGYDTLFSGVSLNEAPTDAILGICVLLDIVGVIDVFGIWELRRIEGTTRHQRRWAWIILISSVAMAGLSAGVFGYATSVQNNESKAQIYEDILVYSFTRETLACSVKNLIPDQSWAREGCGLAKTTRYLLIPMAVSSALVLVSFWILIRDRGGVGWLFGSNGHHPRLANTYELGPASLGPPSTQALQPEMPQPTQQRKQQPA